MKHSLVPAGAVVVLVIAFAPGVRAVNEPDRARLPNFDQRVEAAAKAQANEPPAQAAAVDRLRARVPGVKVERDAILGAPKFIASNTGFLTGPNGEGKGVSMEAARAVPPDDPHRAIKAFLNDHAPLFGFGAESLNAARAKREFTTAHNGLHTTVWEQQLDGIPVFEAVLTAHVTKNRELVSVASQFLPDLAQAAKNGHRNRAANNPTVAARQALALAVKNIGEEQSEVEVIAVEVQPAGPEKRQRLRARSIRNEADARLVWLPLNRTTLRLCWELIFTGKTRGEMFRVLIDAGTGEALVRQGLTEYISDASYRVFTSDSPTPFSPGHATRSTNQPPLVPRVLVVTNAFDTNASPHGWIDDGVNETRGNNVDAHTDGDDNDVADLPRPQGSPARVFDFPIDFGGSPANYGNAAVVQLFYYCNWIHDRLYGLGFTEAAGNFQVNNFGRGGAGNDPVQADAQDGGGFNNANFSTPPDGSSGRMQMYLWDGPNPDIDGDFDGEVVLHEYAHGLSNRRVGGGVGISALQSRGMGEGWSDFYGIAILAEAGDDIHGNWARGGYSRFLASGNFLENYYFGGRRYPYTTDLAKNPLTLKDIDPSQADPHTGVPRSPIVANTADEVHNQGNVWCVTLWEVRANLIARHGFAVGDDLTLKLVTDGMNLSPANPNFLQARDGIIQADLVLTGGANRLELWRAFAKRGMGFSATSPASSTTVGVRESYDMPDDLRITQLADLSSTGSRGGPFAPSFWVFTLTNVGTNTVIWTARSHGLIELSPGTGTLAPASPHVTVTGRLSSAAKDLPSGIYRDTLTFSNSVSGAVLTRKAVLSVGETDYFTEVFDTGGNDLDFQTLTFTPDGSANFYSVCRTSAAFFPTDPGGGTILALSDDDFERVTLADGREVSLHGQQTNVLFIGSNGYLTLRQGDTGLAESIENHFRLPRLSALFDDLNPSSTGTVSWKQLADRVAVTFDRVPRYGISDTNSFQMELFFDGRLRVTWLRVDATGGLAGLSAGHGTPSDFQESNLNSYGACLPSLAVTVPARVTENAGVLGNAGEVRLQQALDADLTVSLASSDPATVTAPAAVVIAAGQTNAPFDLAIADDALLNGSRQVRLTASAAAFRSGSEFILIDDDEIATLSIDLPAGAREGDGLLSCAGRVSISAPPDRSVVVQLSSLVPAELTVPPPAIVIIPAGETSGLFDLQVLDDTRFDGTLSATITASVQNWTGGSGSMSIFDNEVPALALSTPSKVSEGNGTLTNAGRITLGGTILTNLVVTLGSLAPSEIVVPASLVIPANASGAFFHVMVVDDSNLDGAQSAQVLASAPGFGSVTNVISVADNEMPNRPFRPYPEHLSNNVPLDVALSWNAGEGEQIINGNFESGDLTGWGRENRGNGDFIVNGGAFDPESPDGPTAPYAGNFSALSQQQWTGSHALYQDVFIPSGATLARLNWAQRVRNFATDFGPGQEFRVELRNLFDEVMSVPLVTQPGDVLLGDWSERSADLGAYRGQTIRIAFVAEDAQGYFNAHLDNVSVQLGSVLPTTFDVFFGTNATPGPGELLGNTTNTFWALPSLAQFTVYYWQVVARREMVTVPGPVWRFRTRAFPSIHTLVRAGSVWKYRDTGANLGTTWTSTNFNDSGWASGQARLGYGGDGELTTVNFGADPANKYITTYFRRAFAVTNAASYVDLAGRLSRDDGAVLYLNGTEIFRSNMPLPPSAITYLTQASSIINSPNETIFHTFTADAALLVEGTNVLAAEVHQASVDSSDLGYDLELAGTTLSGSNQPPTVAITNPPANYLTLSTPTNFTIGASASDSNGAVAKVEFFVDDVRLAEDLAPPYAASWANPPPGTHTLKAVATDNNGASNIAPLVQVVVNRRGGIPITHVPTNAVWKYLDNGSDQGTAWRGTNFNDNTWAEGSAELGYGDGDESTVVDYGPDIDNKYVTTYFRHTFTNDAVFSSVTLNLVRDDGAVVYLNGVEVFRSNMPGGTINYLTFAAATVNAPQESQFFPMTVNPALLRRGKNVLAAEVHQRDALSSDISFKLELAGVGNLPPIVTLAAPANNTVLTAPPGVPLTATASDHYGSVARVEFFAGATPLGSDSSAPFSYDWQPGPGAYALSALATDNAGGTNRSQVVTVTILPAPSVAATRMGNTLSLAWPATAHEFTLESTFSLCPPILWTPATNRVTSVNGELVTTENMSRTNRFFRLARP